MKAHTQGFKTQISTLGRELYSKITYTVNGTQTILTPEELNRIEPVFNSTLLKSSMKELHIDSNVDIPLETEINYQFAMKVNGEYEYLNYGNYIVYSSEYKADTRSYEIVAYDKLLKSMIDYPEEANGRVFPMTVKSFLNMLCTEIGLTYSGKEFTNSDKIIPTDIYSGIRYTYRDIFDEISAVAGGIICLDDDDEVEVRYPSVELNTTATSNNNTYDITADDNLLKLTIDGKSTQETTTGTENLLDSSTIYQTTKNGITCSYDTSTQIITFNGTSTTDNNSFSFNNTSISITTSTTKLLIKLISGNVENYGTLRLYDSNYSKNIIADLTTLSLTPLILTANSTFTATNNSIRFNNGSVCNNLKIKVMVTNGNYTDWKPFGITPNPDYPQEIESVGYENLYDKNSITEGYRINTIGEPYADSYFNLSNYIVVMPNTNYVFNLERTALYNRIAFYDNNKTVIGLESSSNRVILTPPNTKYMRFGWSKVNYTELQLEQNTIAHSYIPYGKYGIEYKTVGKNLFNINGDITTASYNYYTLTNGIIKIISATTSAKLYWINTIDVETKTYSFMINLINSTARPLIKFLDSNGNILTNITLSGWTYNSFYEGYWKDITTLGNNVFDISMPSQVAKIQIGFVPAILNGEFNNIFFGEKITPNTYEPYQEQTVLIQLDEPLRSIGNVKDQLRIENNTLYVDRYIGRVVLDGSEDECWYFNRYLQAENVIGFQMGTILENIKLSNISPVGYISDYFVSNDGDHWAGNNNHIVQMADKTFLIAIDKTIVSDLATFKTWLSTHNTEVIYELATPTTEAVGSIGTYLLEGINHITLYSGIETDSELKYASNVDTIDEEFLKDVGVDFGTKYGPINSIVLARSAESDNIYLKDDESISRYGLTEIKIKDNQILNDNERDQYLKGLLDRLKGIEFYINDYTSTGVMYYDLLDKYKVKIGDKFYKCIMFNDEPTITQGLVENIYADEPEKTETEYKKSDTTDKRLNQVTLIVDKQAQTIEGYSRRIDEAHNRIDETDLLISSQGARLEVINKVIDEEGNVLSVRPTEGMKFDIDGLEIYQSDNSFNTLINNERMQHRDGDNPITETSKDGFMTTVLKQKNQHYYSWNGSGYDFVDERVDSDGEYPYATYYNGSD